MQHRLAFLEKDTNRKRPNHQRYIKICSEIAAHSDDEEHPDGTYRVIKTLPYRSKNTSKFFRRLDIEMKKADQISGKTVKREPRRLPRDPLPSIFTRAPKELPIDFYDPQWFSQLNAGQKRLIPNAGQVAFLPDVSQSLLPTPHPDEKLSDSAFTAKYLKSRSEPYREALDDLEDDDDADDDEHDEELSNGPGVPLTAANMETSDESDCYSDGDFGSLYDSTDDEAAPAADDDIIKDS
ncbi:uncharacterized protein MELLADRAFT_62944 [Melampsora larici-populina 98AG31]|uniref:Uncharacterized protein n=1 Tax=Melampsora larici-populina (strain 98AG31 / pathotype 3-4-7) TaxID=747676 RepID=F4RLH3_MELLP|nr:uncharacterized protein MELLADRAFT_62944 [Melampsora larici-populina 98AG31]EGG06769.1 hypothetical protein MELLADRAFT_62944 [Melampsora larici-populina 98AG31]